MKRALVTTAERFDSITPVFVAGAVVDCSIFAPRDPAIAAPAGVMAATAMQRPAFAPKAQRRKHERNGGA